MNGNGRPFSRGGQSSGGTRSGAGQLPSPSPAPPLSPLLVDLRYAARQLARSPGIMLIVAALAVTPAARRAGRIDPIEVLRSE